MYIGRQRDVLYGIYRFIGKVEQYLRSNGQTQLYLPDG